MGIRSRFVLVTVLVGAAAATTSCAPWRPDYVSLANGLPAAEMRFMKSFGDGGFGGAPMQGFFLSAYESCENFEVAASFSGSTGNDKVLRVAPDQLTLVAASTNYLTPGGASVSSGAVAGSLNQNLCQSAVRFTPQRDHAYDVKQPSTRPGAPCSIEIIDRATGIAAPGIEVVKYPACH